MSAFSMSCDRCHKETKCVWAPYQGRIFNSPPFNKLCSDCCEIVKIQYAEEFNEQKAPQQKSILAEAEEIIAGPRRESYGPVDESFNRIAEAWSAVIKRTLNAPITAREVALLNIIQKVCRDANKADRDNVTDIAGYAALADKL